MIDLAMSDSRKKVQSFLHPSIKGARTVFNRRLSSGAPRTAPLADATSTTFPSISSGPAAGWQ